MCTMNKKQRHFINHMFDLHGHLIFMQITTKLAYSCCLGNQAEFVLGPGESKSTKTFIGWTIYRFTIEHM